MSRRSPEQPQPDPRLDPYRRAVGLLRSGDRLVGRLAMRVDVVDRTRGWGPWRRVEEPAEMLDWFIDFEPGDPLAHPDGWNDGFIFGDELDGTLESLARGCFLYRGQELTVEWLNPEIAESLLAELEW